ncbi:MAG TPA: hypothetical protein DCS55_13165, partial [Acidimicrobiaceae bacterium]|nr:hypothetical protein [Acidimicrobiaceae bacterium]
LLFTDGLTEARSDAGELGHERVAAHVGGLGPATAGEVALSLVDLAHQVSDGHLEDDIAVLVLGVNSL